ncbi:MAG: sigma-70 family RNA polymerase sigma factor [Kiritimatiellaeota bacterium]|nr:sigma-70 family RNA polymerase sigma factor [Kiritimatiellota bacterium]
MRAKGTEGGGISRVMAAFNAPLLRYAARLLNNATLAQDAVQNAWVKLARREPPVQAPDDEARNWLFRVVHNEAVDIVRAEERRSRLHAAYAAEQEAAAQPLPETGTDEREALVLSCLPALPPLQRQVVLLRLQQGLSYNDIAAIVGETSGYVGNLLHHAIKTLAAEVKRREGEDNVSA